MKNSTILTSIIFIGVYCGLGFWLYQHEYFTLDLNRVVELNGEVLYKNYICPDKYISFEGVINKELVCNIYYTAPPPAYKIYLLQKKLQPYAFYGGIALIVISLWRMRKKINDFMAKVS